MATEIANTGCCCLLMIFLGTCEITQHYNQETLILSTPHILQRQIFLYFLLLFKTITYTNDLIFLTLIHSYILLLQ